MSIVTLHRVSQRHCHLHFQQIEDFVEDTDGDCIAPTGVAVQLLEKYSFSPQQKQVTLFLVFS